MLRVAVDMGGRARVVCAVARTAAEQARGLQGHPGLADGEGMLFPFHPPRAATFHMGTVAFPIDLVFADASGVVSRIVHGARPGERSQWSHPVVGAVVEVPGGWCARSGLSVGHTLRVAGRRLGAQTYNILRTLTEASSGADAELGRPRGPNDGERSPFDVHADPPLEDGYYGKEPLHAPPDFSAPDARPRLIPPERWNDRTLPDQGPDAMDGAGGAWPGTDADSAGWEQGMGYVHPLEGEDQYPVRMNAMRRTAAPWRDDRRDYPARTEADWRAASERFRARCVELGWLPARHADVMQVDLPTLVPKIMAGAMRVGIPWEPVVLNPHREQAVITPMVVGHWLHALGLGEQERATVHDAATSAQGLDALATGLIAAHLAETANIAHAGAENVLVVTKQKGT